MATHDTVHTAWSLKKNYGDYVTCKENCIFLCALTVLQANIFKIHVFILTTSIGFVFAVDQCVL